MALFHFGIIHKGGEVKKLLGVLFIGLMTVVQARADYACVGENNDKLTIKHYGSVEQPSRNTEVLATAVLTSNEHEETFKGKFVVNWNNYELYDANGISVDLQVVKPIFHGGRCGRCFAGEDADLNYYAKLTINQHEEDFTCVLVK